MRVRTEVGSAVVVWRDGAGEAAEGQHHVEWTVDEDIAWAGNTRMAAASTSEVREDGSHIVFRGRLSLTEDGAAVLEVGGALILFDVDPAGTPPDYADGPWVEVRAARSRVSVWPYRC
ncbi:hypothetical protein OG373_39260 [Streptomyces avidinii]|uniref:hypothetical protein n=1 Tax=Streptomyces avidinii TaxID=1895 RepID=UPI003868B7D8|nr:hypothetical protein OG373_39260 [Streptomyces avidinii]